MITWVRGIVKLLPLVGCAIAIHVAAQRTWGADRPNVLLLCIDDLRPELNCYGVDYIRSPNIDALANRSAMFVRHYVQAPTCGASRYAMLTGCYGGETNAALFERAARLAAGNEVSPSTCSPIAMPSSRPLHTLKNRPAKRLGTALANL